MDSVVEDIKSRINIVDLIGEYLRLQKAGANWKALCPFHREKTPSFVVNEEKQIWHCFGCGKGGDVFGFLMEMEGVEFKEALKVLADKAGVELKTYKPEQAVDKNKILEILDLAARFYEKQLWEGMGKEKILNYLRQRGIKDETIKDFRLGYAPPGWRNLLKFLTNKEYTTDDIAKTGLLVEKSTNSEQDSQTPDSRLQASDHYDRFRDRITFPIDDVMGKVVGFTARVAPGGDESQAKYVNTPETSAYHKSKILYGVDKTKKNIKEKDFVIIVEGNTDVIASHQAGINNTVAVSGTALTSDQLDILKRYSENVVMLFDMDSAGEEAMLRSSELAFQKSMNVSVARLPGGKDAAEVAGKNPDDLIRAVKEKMPAMEYFLGRIFSKYDKEKAEDKKKIVRDALNLIRNISNEIERSHWIKELAQKLDVEDKLLIDTLAKSQKRVRGKVEEGEEEKAFQTREETIRGKIIGLMLACPLVWKKMTLKAEEENYLEGDQFFNLLCDKGKQADFKISSLLVAVDDEELGKFLQKLAFDMKYQFGEQMGVSEINPDEALETAEQYYIELGKELRRKKLETIAGDIEKAEEGGSKEELKFLMREFTKLSKE